MDSVILLLWPADYWLAWLAPGLVGCQALPCVEAASHFLVGPAHKGTGCGILGCPKASTGSLVGRIMFQETLGLVPSHWWVNPGSRACSVPLASRTGSWGLSEGLKGPKAGVR